jgi:hypothetical protein
MAKSLIELHREQGRLLERIAGQRRALQLQLQPLVQLNGTGEQLRAQAVRALALARQHATALTMLGVGLVLLRPRLAWRWARRGWWAWRSWRKVSVWLPAGLWR